MEQNVQKEILELRKAREEGMDKMTSDQMKAMTVKQRLEYVTLQMN